MPHSTNTVTLVREQWLQKAITLLDAECLHAADVRLPDKIKATVGFPYRARGKGTHAIGQCFRPTASLGGFTEIFICPTLGDAAEVLSTLVHELIHAAGVMTHGKDFRAIALKVGLSGKMTATVAGPELKERISGWLGKLPPYPHAALSTGAGSGDGPKKQGTRMLKIECLSCGYSARTTQKWIDTGVPICPCGEQMIGPDGETEEG